MKKTKPAKDAELSSIILARHGKDRNNVKEVFNGRLNAFLTPLGEIQARELANKLFASGFDIKHIFCSPLNRAVQTAEICQKTLSNGREIPLSKVDLLVERNYGILEGKPYSEIKNYATEFAEAHGQTYVLEVEGGESYHSLCVRAKTALDYIHWLSYQYHVFGKDILVVSHGAIGRAIQVVHSGKTHEDVLLEPSFKNCEYRVIDWSVKWR